MAKTMQSILHPLPPAPFYPVGEDKLVIIVFCVDWVRSEMHIRIDPIGWGNATWWLKHKGFEGFSFEESVISGFARVLHHANMKALSEFDRRSKEGYYMGMQKMGAVVRVSVDQKTYETIRVYDDFKSGARKRAVIAEVRNMAEALGDIKIAYHRYYEGSMVLPPEFLMDGLELCGIIDRDYEEDGEDDDGNRWE